MPAPRAAVPFAQLAPAASRQGLARSSASVREAAVHALELRVEDADDLVWPPAFLASIADILALFAWQSV